MYRRNHVQQRGSCNPLVLCDLVRKFEDTGCTSDKSFTLKVKINGRRTFESGDRKIIYWSPLTFIILTIFTNKRTPMFKRQEEMKTEANKNSHSPPFLRS